MLYQGQKLPTMNGMVPLVLRRTSDVGFYHYIYIYLSNINVASTANPFLSFFYFDFTSPDQNRSLRILCQNNTEKDILMETSFLAGHRVSFSEPYVKSRYSLYTLNRGIIFGVDEELTEEQISYEIGLPAKRIIKKIGGENKITQQVILYFEGEIPAYVFFLWRRYKVSVYISEPTRCYTCQKFGHKANKCNSSLKCPICLGHHSYEDCDVRKNNNKDERKTLCPNCKGEHSASYNGCRIYQEAKTIKKIQISESLSYAEALKTFRNKKTSDHTVPSNVQPEQNKSTTSDKHSNHVSNDNASQDKISAYQSPFSNKGNVSPINPDHGNTHENCVNTENLINFVQSIGVLLTEKNSKEELIAKLYQNGGGLCKVNQAIMRNWDN